MHDNNQQRADVARMVASTVEGEVPASQSKTFRAAFADLLQGARQRELWFMLGIQDIKQRYRRSVLGPFWITIATGVMAAALGLLYSMLFQIPTAQFLPHVTVGLIMWNFISGAIKEGSTVFIENEGLIKQLPAPLSVHVYRLVWRQTLFLAHNLIIWVLLIIIFPRHLGWEFLLIIPGLALLLINGVWVAMFFGIVATRFRDIAPLLEALTQLLFYVTPIVWMTDTLENQGGAVSERAKLAQLNPLYHYMEVVRAPMIGQPVEAYHWWIVIGCTLAGIGLAALAMRQWRFRVSYWV
ncbi:ABC transporter permease [Corynebacterium flavescens]|uniref:ABC transporter permease n=2 Tax=Corynebacteriaceae TaxID=1653 RepID=A0A1L7CJ75_CORFL|nr:MULTISPECIES: ABC transporter permease [Corynebacterium]APT85911.1 sugar ABC transporter permease [Corynebacterium flavescens]MDN6099824.1 ABC transporter permease [Corynebacterium flavescens]MDN6198447.1 ABC transporter permease [Corynebacterium flavescens]MDN6226351.1 ABC transporter permease [Corynebacterium flavescens]MDN6235707.1 ABC transporter permease [Corynebacterium flavescens]